MWSVIITTGLLALLRSAASQCPAGSIGCGSNCAVPCDGMVDCDDHSDETAQLCASVVCNNGSSASSLDFDLFNVKLPEFKCNYGGCINENFVCNGPPDCWDGSDETAALCGPKPCSRREFRCDYGGCIRRLSRCNGITNCIDKSDETAKECSSNTCNSRQFRCHYGGCILKAKRCNGSPDCIDNSDESEEECGAGHTTNAPATMSPPPVVTPPSPVTPPRIPIPPVTPAPQPGTPGIIFTEEPAPIDWCRNQGLCACPEPNQHFCVPCDKRQTCSELANEAVCSIKPAGGPHADVQVDVLSCGLQPVINLAGFVRNNEVAFCGSSEGVPTESVVLASCWGTQILAQCNADGKWYSYNEGTASPPSQSLCQFHNINSPVCGRRPRYVSPPGKTIHLKAQPQWPWMVGLKKLNRYICTATIISPHYLLTAGHCVTRTQETSEEVMDVRNLRIQRVDATGKIISDFVTHIHLHPRYTTGRRPSHDVALVRTQREIIFSHQVYPACVLTEGFPADKLAATFNRTVEEYKWEMILQQNDYRCHSPNDRCANILNIDKEQFCAIDTESKRYLPEGSSGGPYMVNIGNDVEENWVVAGIVSSSYRQTSCTRSFTIFTSVSRYWDWISKCVQDGVCS